MKKTKNVLWIMTDQHLASCLGCMGNSIIQTPNLDKLAAEGVLFENAFCQSPVCMASRASLLTGRYPEAVRVRGMGVLPPTETTFPEWLQRHGYHTGLFGKLHLTLQKYTVNVLKTDCPVSDWRRFAEDACLAPIPDDPYKENYGFETSIEFEDNCQGNYHDWLKEEAPQLLEKEFRWLAKTNPEEYKKIVEQRMKDGRPNELYVSPVPSEYHHSSYIAKHAEDYIRLQKQSKKPWMTFCSFVAPHHPFEAPQDQIDRYNDSEIPLPDPEINVDIKNCPKPLIPAIDEMWKYPEELQRRIIKHYYASISLIDDCVGRLLKTLEETGQRENTVIIFVADHGEHLGHHGLLRKPSFHYDETLRVPLIINSKEVNTGRRVNNLVELTDVYPTLLGLLGLPINRGVQGINWSDALRQNKVIGRDDIYSDMYDFDDMTHGKASGPFCACQTLRTEEWKLNIYPTYSLECSQLFDLKNDPKESHNIFHKPEYRDIRENMLWRMMTRVHKNIDPLPVRMTQW